MKKVLAIIGPTASGKTELSVKLAKNLNAEIISLDSRQIYKDMSIGTAQPTEADKNGIRHHLINIKPPTEIVAAGSYSTLVIDAVSDIYSRSKIPIICGGAGLYYRALLNGIFSESKTDQNIRTRLESEYDIKGPKKMLARLFKSDPDYAKVIHPNNKKRLVRALEILESTGVSPSNNFKSQNNNNVPKLNLFTLYLEWDRHVLKQRIAFRTKKMLEDGWVDEVANLIKQYPKQQLHPLDSIGYREIISYLNKELKIEDLEQKIIIKTRQFAKRQIQWFKNEKIDLCLKMDHEISINDILQKINKNIL